MNCIRSVSRHHFIAMCLISFAVAAIPAHAQESPGVEAGTKDTGPATAEVGTTRPTGTTAQTPSAAPQASATSDEKDDEVESEEVTGTLIRRHHHVYHPDVKSISEDQAAQEGDRQLSDTLGKMPQRP